MDTLLAFKKDQDEWSEKEEQLKKSLQSDMAKIEEIEIALNEKDKIPTSTEKEVPDTSLHASKKNDEFATGESLITILREDIENQKREIQQLKREKEIWDNTKEPHKESSDNTKGLPHKESSDNVDDTGKLEKELQLVREQTNQKLAEFDSLKTALLRDLENRCQKVVELEMLLDEAREQYQSLLVQVKNSNSKTLQQKCIFLQRNLEQLTTVQQQLVNENNRLKLENQVYVKQLAIRNERIHGLELLLQESQEQLQKHAASESEPAKLQKVPSKPGALGLAIPGGRIAKPIRGGGGGIPKPVFGSFATNSPPSPNTETKKPSSSIWDLFRSSKISTPTDTPSPTKQPNASTNLVASHE